MSIAEAADALGLTRDAIRKRVKRGSIEWEVDPSGETYVYIDASGHNGDASETVGDTSGLNGDMSAGASGHALVESLQDQVEYLRREVEVWQEESRRKDHLLAAALERIPAIEPPETNSSSMPEDAPAEAPTEEPGQPTAASEGADKGPGPAEDSPASEGRSEGRERSWWRRIFGG